VPGSSLGAGVVQEQREHPWASKAEATRIAEDHAQLKKGGKTQNKCFICEAPLPQWSKNNICKECEEHVRHGQYHPHMSGHGGKTVEKWFSPEGNLGGWGKDQKAETRRSHAIASTPKGSRLDARRELARKRLQALANVTQDPETKRTAQSDADYFSQLRSRGGKIGPLGREEIERERDIAPEVHHERDFGWLPYLEKAHYRQMDEDESAKVKHMVNQSIEGEPAEAAVARARLKTEYPDIYEGLYASEVPSGGKVDWAKVREKLGVAAQKARYYAPKVVAKGKEIHRKTGAGLEKAAYTYGRARAYPKHLRAQYERGREELLRRGRQVEEDKLPVDAERWTNSIRYGSSTQRAVARGYFKRKYPELYQSMIDEGELEAPALAR